MSEAVERDRIVLLDAGGVLLDLDYAYLVRLLDSRGCATSEAGLARAEARARTEIERRVREGGKVGEAWRDYFAIILGDAGFPVAQHDEVIDVLWEAHNRFGLWTVPIPGAPETVRELRRRGYRLGVVSNAEGRVERDLDGAGYDGMFETVVDSHVVGVEKPDPRIFGIALDRMQAGPDHAVYLGDVPSVDVAGATASGIRPILLDRHDLYPDVEAPRLRSIRELPDWLEANA